MDSGMFFSGGSPYSPEQFSSPRYKLEKCEIKHGGFLWECSPCLTLTRLKQRVFLDVLD